MRTRVLLICGVVSSLWYVIINAVVPLFYPHYSAIDYTVSELSAIGSPTRTLWVALVIPYVILFAAFGWGVIRAAKNRWLASAGWLIIFYCAFNLYWPPMHTREILAAGGGTLSDTLHLVWAGVTVGLFLIIMIVTAIGLDWKSRIYTAASAVLLSIFGWLTSAATPNIGANLPTPLVGVYERINIAMFLLWVATLAILLMRGEKANDYSPSYYPKN